MTLSVSNAGCKSTSADWIEESHCLSNLQKDAFLATLAHEIRNPLGAAKNAVKVARLAKDQADLLERALDIADRQLTQLGWLVEELLDADRIARGALTLRKQNVELQQLIDLAVEGVMPHFCAKRQSIKINKLSGEARMLADPRRLTQILTNLMINAHQSTGEEGIIEICAEMTDADLCIRIKDNGIGIAEEDLDSVFEMSAQASDTAGERHPGLGIGLALVRNLVALHGGHISACSAGIGKGSEFVVVLPCH